MNKFTGSISTRGAACLILLLGAGGLYFVFFPVNQSLDTQMLMARTVFFLMAGGVGALGLYYLLESFVSYTVDGTGVTRQGWNGTKEMRWSDVARIDVSGQRDSTLTLSDNGGRKLEIQRSVMSAATVAELNTLMEPYLAPVRELQMREVGGIDNVYRPTRVLGWIGAGLTLMMGLMTAFFATIPQRAGEEGAFIVMMVMMGGFVLLGLGLAAYGFTHSLTITQSSLTESSLFRTREIPFHHVTAVGSRMVATKNGSFELTCVEGDGQKINLTSQMKDYSLLVEYIRNHVNTEARATGEVQAQERTEKQKRQQRKALPVVAGIYLLVCSGIGGWVIQRANTKLANYRLMETQGQRGEGQITGWYMEGSKTTSYVLKFAFDDASGHHLQGASPVARELYQTARVGAPVQVVYVPNTSNFMLIQSIGKSNAEAELRRGYMLIGGGVLMVILLLATSLKRKKPATTTTD